MTLPLQEEEEPLGTSYAAAESFEATGGYLVGAQGKGRGVYGNASAGGGRSLRISGCGREHGSRRMNSVTAENAVLIEWAFEKTEGCRGIKYFFFFSING